MFSQKQNFCQTSKSNGSNYFPIIPIFNITGMIS